jgi:hypothetical protein
MSRKKEISLVFCMCGKKGKGKVIPLQAYGAQRVLEG